MNVILKRRPIQDINALTHTSLPSLLQRLYTKRGITRLQELERSIHNLLTYHQLTGINQAVDLLFDTIIHQRKLMVIGDFDVDGATGIALTVLSLRAMGMRSVDFLVPNRFKDGYGLNSKIVEQALLHDIKVIITVDNGISSHQSIDLAKKKGISVIVTDHHLPDITLPNADAIINPNLNNCHFSSKALSGVGVAFYLMIAFRAKLYTNGWFIQKKHPLPKLINFLDLVALGTVADISSMDQNNRILVYHGLHRIRSGYCCPGIRALIEISNCNLSQLCIDDLSFSLIPRLNSAGRLYDMSIGVLLLLTNNIYQARKLAIQLNTLNKIRRHIEFQMTNEALTLCKSLIANNKTIPNSIIMYQMKWHQGIIGIVATRIKERFYRPVIVFSPVNEYLLKGSGRSIDGLHIRNLIDKLNILYPELILEFGGHSMAIGLILQKNKFNQFCQYFTQLVNEYITSDMLNNIIWSDGELTNQELSLHTAYILRHGGPWGKDFPDPLFDGTFRILNQKIIGKKHLKLILQPISSNIKICGIMFNIDPYVWPNNKIHTIQIAYKLSMNIFYKHRSLQLLIQHIWPL